jgi:hypothetical protein
MDLPMPDALMVSAKAEQPLDADTRGEAAAGQKGQPAFVTAQSLATFTGASALVTAVWKVIAGAVSASWADKRWVPLILCGLVGIYLIAKALEGTSGFADKFGAVLVGLANTALLWAAVVGIDVGLDSTGVTNSTGGAP